MSSCERTITEWEKEIAQDEQLRTFLQSLKYTVETERPSDLEWFLNRLSNFYASLDLYMLCDVLTTCTGIVAMLSNPLEFAVQEGSSSYKKTIDILTRPLDVQKKQLVSRDVAALVLPQSVKFVTDPGDYCKFQQHPLPGGTREMLVKRLNEQLVHCTCELVLSGKACRGPFDNEKIDHMYGSSDVNVTFDGPLSEEQFEMARKSIREKMEDTPGCFRLHDLYPLISLEDMGDNQVGYHYCFRYHFELVGMNDVRCHIRKLVPDYEVKIMRTLINQTYVPGFYIMVPRNEAWNVALIISKATPDEMFGIEIGNIELTAEDDTIPLLFSKKAYIPRQHKCKDPWVDSQLTTNKERIYLTSSDVKHNAAPIELISLTAVINTDGLTCDEVMNIIRILLKHPAIAPRRGVHRVYGKMIFVCLVLYKRKWKEVSKLKYTPKLSADDVAIKVAAAEQMRRELIQEEEKKEYKKARKKKNDPRASPLPVESLSFSREFLQQIIENNGVDEFINVCRLGKVVKTSLATTKSTVNPILIFFDRWKSETVKYNRSTLALKIKHFKIMSRFLAKWKIESSRQVAEKYMSTIYIREALRKVLFLWIKNVQESMRIAPWHKKHVQRIEIKDNDGTVNYLSVPRSLINEKLQSVIDQGDPHETFRYIALKM